MLGNAWNSFDVYFALGRTLKAKGDGLLALMAWQRCLELVGEGQGSLVQRAPEDLIAYYGAEWEEGAEGAFSRMQHFGGPLMLSVDRLAYQAIAVEYVRQRENAQAWHDHRTEFMMARLEAGQHPDTHDDFWTGYEAIPEIEIVAENIHATRAKRHRRITKAIFLCAAGVVIFLVVGTAYVVRRRYRKV
jgi:hypothetical protein